jgi:hypothetical protein
MQNPKKVLEMKSYYGGAAWFMMQTKFESKAPCEICVNERCQDCRVTRAGDEKHD